MSAQTININQVDVCAGQEVLLPVTGASLLNVGAITLFIGFDTTNLTYLSIENIDPQLTGMSMNMMTSPSQLAFAWSSTTPINFPSDKLFDLKFISSGQSAPVYFNSGCEFANPVGGVIPVIYSAGAVTSNLPTIVIQPTDTTIIEGGHAIFTVGSPNALSYFWMESQDHGTSWLTLEDDGTYTGTHTDKLSIYPVPLSFDRNQYQCVLIRENCQITSIPVMLSVDALTSAETLNNPDIKDLFISPVPFNDHATIEFTMPSDGNARILALSCVGQIVSEIDLPAYPKGHHHILLNTSDWRPGIYFVKLIMTYSNQKSFKVIKSIKN
ncbi:MAG: cohesin domain-containing protein [Bacteroidales bacterium]|nr:cohesin domain-containing protein [Bacteroidales bacterium]